MKAHTFTNSTFSKLTLFVGLFFMTFLGFNSLNAQSQAQGKTIKGVVTTEGEPLAGANVILKGTSVGTSTNRNGEFTFPRPLKVNDVLVFSFLSFETQEIRIKADTDFLEVKMTDDLIEILGAPASEKPYKSKRSKRKQ
ncbi:carboxypeptidase-like regulatory domain-containing protein [Winogradskyella maritima]|uniref:Carboxypeptidase-like regulatory domain-containing protein n=1 Tax=Winogradskyella maritima TaxID=1517766 RepID=A0ABV8AIY6_9FLAO|nr:carboxypeptidase-like regulatory domain-containing protein [Winogradskyella maritima]